MDCSDSADRVLMTWFVADVRPDGGAWTVSEETGSEAMIGPVLGESVRWFTAEESTHGEAGHLIGVIDAAT